MSTIKVSMHDPATDTVTNSTVAYEQAAAKSAEQQALWDAYQSSAQAGLSAQLAAITTPGAWTATGTVYEGSAQPATPTTTVVPYTIAGVHCGAGVSTFTRTGDGVHAVTSLFFKKNISGDTTTQYRWIEEQAYIPPGSWILKSTTEAIICTFSDHPEFASGGSLAAQVAAAAGLAGTLGGYNPANSGANIAALQGWLYPLATATQAALAGQTFNNGGFDWRVYDPEDPGAVSAPISGNGSCAYIKARMFRPPSTTMNVDIGQVYVDSLGQTGRWRLESKVDSTATASSVSGACKSSSYLAATPRSGITDWGNGSPGTSRARFVIRINQVEPPENTNRYYTLDNNDTYLDIVEGDSVQPSVPFSFTYPGSSFLLQSGTPLAGYSAITGAFFYDIHLKKWGKYRPETPYQTLVDFSSINSREASNGASDLGMAAGILTASGGISQFELLPAESLLRYGKIGFRRLGFTNLFEVRVHFRRLCNCSISIQGSIDGESLDPDVLHTETVATVREKTLHLDLSARWFSVALSGDFDLTGLEFRGRPAGRR